MKSVKAENMVAYECEECNHIMFFSEATHLFRINCPMCNDQFKLESDHEVTIILPEE